MDNTVLWLVIGAAVIVAGISVILLQKKAGEAKKYLAEINSIKHQFDQRNGEILETGRGLERAADEAKNRAEKLEIELNALNERLQQAEEQRDKHAAEIAELSQKAAEPQNSGTEEAELQEELANVKAELADTVEKLALVEKDFAAQMDEVVQSSMEKLTHAEHAKEEAIQAAQDNFEAAAEANAKLKEAEALLEKLQGQN